MKLLKGWLMTLGMFSILPVPHVWDEAARPWVIPLLPWVGLIPGALAAGVAWLIAPAGWSRFLSAVLVLLCWHLATGFIHIDGLMDTSDAVFSRASLEKRLAILKDPHVGSFAVIALVVVMLLQLAALDNILARPTTVLLWLLIPVQARAWASLAVLLTPKVLTNGYAQQFRSPSQQKLFLVPVLALLLTFGAAILFGSWLAVWILLAMLIAAAVAWLGLQRSFGGISGDLAGFILVVSETVALLTWAILPEVVG